MSSNSNKVVQFNREFGVLESNVLTPKPNILKEDPKLVEFCMKLIREEARETEEAIKNNDFVEFVDGLIDQLYVIYGALSRIGIDADKAFDIVHENNMSKLCKTEEEAQRSVKNYKDGYDKYHNVIAKYKCINDQNPKYWVVYNELNDETLDICRTEIHAQGSVQSYEANKLKFCYDSPAYRQSPDGEHWVVYNQSTKKVLKSIEWKPVDLKEVCGVNTN